METPYIKNLRKQYATAIKKAIQKENTKLNNLYKDFSISIFEESRNNEALKNLLKANPKISEAFQKLLAVFEESDLSKEKVEGGNNETK